MTIAKPKPLRTAERTLVVLKVLNQHRAATLAEVAELAELPRPTAARMLETLIGLGYAERVPGSAAYRVTERIIELSVGLRFIDQLIDAAIEPMESFTRAAGWPVSLATISSGTTVRRHSTILLSPLAFEAPSSGKRFSLLESANGLVCLAFSSKDERCEILSQLEAIEGPSGPEPRWRAMLRDPSAVDQVLERIRDLGYAGTRSSRAGRLQGIAVPILRGGLAIAGISMRYPKSAMTEAEAARRYVPDLQKLARKIAMRHNQRYRRQRST